MGEGWGKSPSGYGPGTSLTYQTGHISDTAQVHWRLIKRSGWALGGGGLDGLDHKWFLRWRSFCHCNFDCAPERLNYLQGSHEFVRNLILGDAGFTRGNQNDGCLVAACKLRSVVSPVSKCERPGAPTSTAELLTASGPRPPAASSGRGSWSPTQPLVAEEASRSADEDGRATAGGDAGATAWPCRPGALPQ